MVYPRRLYSSLCSTVGLSFYSCNVFFLFISLYSRKVLLNLLSHLEVINIVQISVKANLQYVSFLCSPPPNLKTGLSRDPRIVWLTLVLNHYGHLLFVHYTLSQKYIGQHCVQCV